MSMPKIQRASLPSCWRVKRECWTWFKNCTTVELVLNIRLTVVLLHSCKRSHFGHFEHCAIPHTAGCQYSNLQSSQYDTTHASGTRRTFRNLFFIVTTWRRGELSQYRPHECPHVGIPTGTCQCRVNCSLRKARPS